MDEVPPTLKRSPQTACAKLGAHVHPIRGKEEQRAPRDWIHAERAVVSSDANLGMDIEELSSGTAPSSCGTASLELGILGLRAPELGPK